MKSNNLKPLFKFLFIFVLLYGCCLSGKADTIDYWHVKYNNKLIRKYSENNSNRVISINLIRAKANDRITVNYGRDTPCPDCVNELILEDDKKKQFSIVKGKGTFNPLSFSLGDIKKTGRRYCHIYYRENGKSKILLFTIKFT